MMEQVQNEELQEIVKIGATVEVKNGGHHWIIKSGSTRIDYWPSSERYQITVKSELKRGFKGMLTALQKLK